MNTINFYGKEYEMGNEIICDCGCIFKKDKCEIGISYSDKFLCEKHKPKIDLEKEKQIKINNIKNKTKEIILKKYSEKAQFNILTGLIGTATEKTACKNFINSIIMQGKNFQNQVNAIAIIEDLNNFTYQFIEE